MEQVREIISKGASADQLQHELKVLTREDRQSLLDLACVRDASAVIPPSEVLAMKADLSITWSKLRVLRRYKQLMITAHVLLNSNFKMDEGMERQLGHRKEGADPCP